MSSGSSIEWTEATWNPVVGCTRASRGCDHCYAVTMTHRLEAMGRTKYAGLTVLNGRGDRHFNGVVRTVPEALEIPLHWRKPRMIFVNSMSDLFHGGIYGQGHDDSTWKEGKFNAAGFEFLLEVWHTMLRCPRHTFQILTKRPRIMADMVPRVMAKLNQDAPLPNVWLLASCEDQEQLDKRVPPLLRCPAAVRGLSLEPLLGPIDLAPYIGAREIEAGSYRDHEAVRADWLWHLHWVIIGGESGGGARPCNIDWIRSIIAQCREAGVACFVKQLGALPREHINVFNSGAWPKDQKAIADGDEQVLICLKDRKGGDPVEWPADLRVREFPIGHQEAQNAQKETESV